MLISYRRGQTSVILRVKILDSSVSTGAGKTGLAFNTSGLAISTIADNEASATAYTVAGSTIETIATLGTYAAPTATKCRFREVDATNHKGVYEVQIADARFAVSSAKFLIVSISGATGAAETDVVIPLQDMDPYDSVRGGMTALPNAVAAASGGLLTAGTGTNQLSPSGGGVDVQTIKGQALTCSAGVTFGAFVGQGTAALLVNGSGYVTVVANNDKANYSLSSSGLANVVIETGCDIRQAVAIIAAACAGVSTGVDTGSPVFKGLGVATTRISATAASGNRSAVTLTLP